MEIKKTASSFSLEKGDKQLSEKKSQLETEQHATIHEQYAEENTLFFMQGPRGGPRSFYFDATNVF